MASLGTRPLLQGLLAMGWELWDPRPFDPLGCAAVWEPSISAGTYCDSRIHPLQRGYQSFLNIKAHMGTQDWDR